MGRMVDIGKESGHPAGMALDVASWWNSGTGMQFVAESLDPNPDLRFPQSVKVWDEMRRTDSQAGSVLRAITLPIRRARWALQGEDVRPEVMDFVRSELGLVEPDKGRNRRRRQGVVWSDHIRMACLMLPLGFMPFEQVYEPEVGGQWAERLGMPSVIHLRKLAERMPSTLLRISVGRDGGLESITQAPSPGDYYGQITLSGIKIPVDRLVMYVNDREGADWTGTSILRTAYKDWYIKDQLVRINAQSVERNGMGVPVVQYSGEEQKAEAMSIANNFRAGATAGLALPNTMKAELIGVSGGTKDATPSIKYHDQQIAKSVLAMFLDLGHDAGARSLGDTFTDVFTDSLQTTADEMADTATEHIVRDLVELNFGPDEPYPILTAGDLSANVKLSVASLSSLVSGGIVRADDKLEAWVRSANGLPEADPATAREEATPTPPVDATAQIRETAGLSEGPDHMARAEALLAELRNLRSVRGNV